MKNKRGMIIMILVTIIVLVFVGLFMSANSPSSQSTPSRPAADQGIDIK